MAVDYSTLKKGGFMRQKQKNCFSLRLKSVGGHLDAKQLATIAEVSENMVMAMFISHQDRVLKFLL